MGKSGAILKSLGCHRMGSWWQPESVSPACHWTEHFFLFSCSVLPISLWTNGPISLSSSHCILLSPREPLCSVGWRFSGKAHTCFAGQAVTPWAQRSWIKAVKCQEVSTRDKAFKLCLAICVCLCSPLVILDIWGLSTSNKAKQFKFYIMLWLSSWN